MVGYRSTIMCLPTLMLALVFMTSFAEAQSGSIPSCGSKLVPCVNYLDNSTTPPSSCCNPLREAVANELTCLCNLFNTPDLLKSFNISVDSALQLSRRCGVTTGISSCKTGSAPSPASGAPPATPGGDKGGAGRVSFAGLSFLVLFWASMLFN